MFVVSVVSAASPWWMFVALPHRLCIFKGGGCHSLSSQNTHTGVNLSSSASFLSSLSLSLFFWIFTHFINNLKEHASGSQVIAK